MSYKIVCVYANECRSYKKECHTCKNNEYKPKTDFYEPTMSKIIVEWLVYILLIVGLGYVMVLIYTA